MNSRLWRKRRRSADFAKDGRISTPSSVDHSPIQCFQMFENWDFCRRSNCLMVVEMTKIQLTLSNLTRSMSRAHLTIPDLFLCYLNHILPLLFLETAFLGTHACSFMCTTTTIKLLVAKNAFGKVNLSISSTTPPKHCFKQLRSSHLHLNNLSYQVPPGPKKTTADKSCPKPWV